MSGFVVSALVLSLSATVSCLGSAPPQPCLAPLQWEGRTVQYDHGTGRNTRAAVTYDAQNQRIRVLEQKTGHTPCKKYEFIKCYEMHFNVCSSCHCKILSTFCLVLQYKHLNILTKIYTYLRSKMS